MKLFKLNNDAAMKDNFANLHLKSTIGELDLFESIVNSENNLTHVTSTLLEHPNQPGEIIVDGNKNSRRLLGVISRKSFFECLTKPFYAELFSNRPLSAFLEVVGKMSYITLPSTMQITSAVATALEQSKDLFETGILVEFDKGVYKLLDTYQLVLAYSHINSLALNALKEASDFKTELLSIAAHDLKNPLNTIIGLTKVLQSELESGKEEILDIIDNISATAKHMHNLIIELLNSTVIEAGRIQLRKQLIDLSELVSAIVYQNQTLAQGKSQTLEFFYDHDAEFLIEGDTLKIRESIENLISNAIKYSKMDSAIIVNLYKNCSKVRFSVKDQGPGLTEEDMSKLFGKFQRLSALPTGGESSTGLGLYIAKQIIELHDGRIWAESPPGYGSEFFIELPTVELD